MFYGDLLEKRRTEAEKEQEKFVAQIIYIFISSTTFLFLGFFLVENHFRLPFEWSVLLGYFLIS